MRNQLSRMRRSTLLLLACAGLVAACGRMRMGSDEDRTYLIFQNQSIDQVDVYAAISGSEVRRLGTVMAGRTDTLELSSSITSRAGGINILARIFASNRVLQSGPLSLSRGDRMLVQLPSNELTLAVLPAP